MAFGLGRRPRWRMCALAGLALVMGGCAAMSPSSHAVAGAGNAGATPPPLVQNCAIVGISSPSKYACDGKVYTSFQLLKLRQDWNQPHGG